MAIPYKFSIPTSGLGHAEAQGATNSEVRNVRRIEGLVGFRFYSSSR